MTEAKLEKLREEIRGLYGSPQRRDLLITLAKAVGRRRKKARGPHTRWVRSEAPKLQPLSIPNSPKITTGTSGNILEQLERDTIEWGDFLRRRGDQDAEDH